MDPFGANEWLVDELYDLYKQDKNKVDPHWWDFFADYSPSAASQIQSRTQESTQLSQSAAQETSTPITPAPTPAAVVPSSVSASNVHAPVPIATPAAAPKPADAEAVVLRGAAARVVTNMSRPMPKQSFFGGLLLALSPT